MAVDTDKLDTSKINEWRSIVTLIVFVFASKCALVETNGSFGVNLRIGTDLSVLFRFNIPIYIPHRLWDAVLDVLSALRVISPRQKRSDDERNEKVKRFVRLDFPMNFVTAPLIADLFLLAILAIGRDEVRGGTIGTDYISPIDIMLFFISLAYIAISIDASGLIRWLAYKVLLWGGKNGHKLFFYLYTFFALLGSFIGNDPVILSGTPFLAYMTRVSSNIEHPRAWIFTQFAIANIVSAILVSSNPTNLVLAGAFQIKFIDYTVNMIVPVVITVIVLFPFLLYVIFRKESLIPKSITMHELPERMRAEKPKNPCIPYARGAAEEEENVDAEEEENMHADDDRRKLLELAEIMHPFLDKKGAAFGAFVIAATLVIVLALNAANPTGGELPVFWVTLPAAFVMFCWDVGSGWLRREETREIAHNGRRELEQARDERARAERARAERAMADVAFQHEGLACSPPDEPGSKDDSSGGLENFANRDKEITIATKQFQHSRSVTNTTSTICVEGEGSHENVANGNKEITIAAKQFQHSRSVTNTTSTICVEGEGGHENVANGNKEITIATERFQHGRSATNTTSTICAEGEKSASVNTSKPAQGLSSETLGEKKREMDVKQRSDISSHEKATLVSLVSHAWTWLRETFPTATAVLTHLPLALVPFALTMFILVQALVTKGWVPVFAHGWDHWVNKTGTVGAIGGMGFVSVVFCNVKFLPLSQSPLAISANILPLHANSLQARILEPLSCYAGYCSHGRRFTRKTGYQSPIGHSGPRYTAWRSASTTALLVRHLAPRWLVSYGGIFLGESIFISEPATLRATMFLLL
jgi:Na+/H+ antiporter NhaD/arsenite permease-like protein